MFSSFSSHPLNISNPPLITDILDHVPDGSYLLDKFCEGLRHSKVASGAKIVSCARYKDDRIHRSLVLHRSLILHGQKDRRPRSDFYIRLDRRPVRPLLELLDHSGTAPAKDTVCIYCVSVQGMIDIWSLQACISESLKHLLEPVMTEEARMIFPAPAALSSVGVVLMAIISESHGRKFTLVSFVSLPKSDFVRSNLRERKMAGFSLPLLKSRLPDALVPTMKMGNSTTCHPLYILV